MEQRPDGEAVTPGTSILVAEDHPAVVGDPNLAGTFSPTKGFKPVTKVKRDESSAGKGR